MPETLPAKRSATVTWTDPSLLYAAHGRMTSIDLFRAVRDGAVPLEPAMALLGVTMAVVEPGMVTLTLEPGERHCDLSGTVQPGILAALADTAAGYAVHTRTALGTRCATLELRVSLLEPVTVASGTISCVGHVIRIGSRTAMAEARIFDAAGRLYATMSTTFMVLNAVSV